MAFAYNDEGNVSVTKLQNFFPWRFSMSAFQREQMKEEKRRKLEERRERLRLMLQEERDQLEAELTNVRPDRDTLTRQLVGKTDALRSAREERRKNVQYERLS